MILGFAVGACAATTSTCPLDAKLVTTTSPTGRVELCTASDPTIASLPEPGRTAESSLALLANPGAMAGGVMGPYTSWYPNGRIHAHGAYRDLGARSVPDGIWAFWSDDGHRRSLGTYFRGQPVGCFAIWDADGSRSTGHVTGASQIRVDNCDPPSDRMMLEVEGRAPEEVEGPAKADATVNAFFGYGPMGARNDGQIEAHPMMTGAFGLEVRKAFGKLWLGPKLGIKTSTSVDSSAYNGGLSIGYAFTEITSRVRLEGSFDLGVQHTHMTAAKPMQDGHAELNFWMPLPGLELRSTVDLSDNLQVVVAARVEGTPPYDVGRFVTYCFYTFGGGCYAAEHETWHVSGIGAGVMFGLRFLIR